METRNAHNTALRRLAEIADIPSGWLTSAGDTNPQGSAVSSAALMRARALLDSCPQMAPHLGIFPMDNGGVSMEIRAPDVRVSVKIDPSGDAVLVPSVLHEIYAGLSVPEVLNAYIRD